MTGIFAGLEQGLNWTQSKWRNGRTTVVDHAEAERSVKNGYLHPSTYQAQASLEPPERQRKHLMSWPSSLPVDRVISQSQQCRSRALTAITTQQIPTYGLNRSPTLAHFQKIPNTLASQFSRLSAIRARARAHHSPIPIPIHDLRKGSVSIGRSTNH